MRLLSIDPGSTHSAYAIIDARDCRPVEFAKVDNREMLAPLGVLRTALYDQVAIEQVGHYGTGMPAGRDVFDTCRAIGRYEQILDDLDQPYWLVGRVKVKVHLTGAANARDSNIRQALVDRFAPGVRNYGKGVKADPGWFYGFAADCWQAYALAVYAADTIWPAPTEAPF